MKKYRSKPVVIEAVQYTAETCRNIHAWMGIGHVPDDTSCGIGCLVINTLEGEMAASPGDFIIKGLKGEFYPCKPDIFAMKYEEAGE